MVSGFVDSLKLVLSDKYEVSDSDYKTLSDILVSKGLSDDAFDSGLVQIISLMIKYNHRFPISLTFLKEMWEYENISYNFVKMLSIILKRGIVSLRKVKRETFLKDSSITKSNTENLEQDLYVVVYGSKDFNEILDVFTEVLNNQSTSVTEGVIPSMPKKLGDVIGKSNKLLKSMGISIDVESYTKDDALGTARLNLVINSTSNYSCNDSVILKIAKKHIKGNEIKGLETYREDNSSIFLGIDLSTKESRYGMLPESIYEFIEELEIEGV